MEDSNPESVASPAGQSSGKSKLDTLSKEDLIKFAKKQMVSMQKMKSKCGDLEKEVEALKLRPVSEPVSDSSIIIQELTERMDAVLLERAESQQSLTLLRREHEELRRQAQDTTERLAALQEELDLKNKEHAEMQKHISEITANLKTTCAEYESRISRTQEELEEAQLQWRSEVDALKDSQQMSLTEAQQEVENLQKEIQRMNAQYEEDLRFLEEQLELNNTDFERERERLLLLQDELSEQLALKEGFLQDVQEEEEDAARPVPAQETSELPAAEDSSDELRLTLEELQTHNMMLQEELVLLRNVKLELESDLKQLREEFTVEKEEMEFRINELQMNKDTGGEQCSISEEEESQQADTGLSVERETQHVENLQDQHSPLDETPTVRSIIPDQDVELRGRAEHFIKQYKAMKEKTTASLLDLQERLKSVLQEPEGPVDEGGQNVSYEELQHRNEEILVNLQHQEALVTQMLELIDVGPECELLSKQEDQLETKEKDERVKSLEEELSALQAQQEVSGDTLRLLKSQIQSLSEERKDLQERLSAVQCHITEILQQSSGEAEADDASDISTLVDRLWSKCLAEKTLLSRRVEQLEVELDGLRQTAEEHEVELQTRITELQREKDLQKTSLEDVLLDVEGLQKDLSQVQAMNEKLSTENHRLLAEVSDSKKNLEEEGREGSDERDDEADELQQALADKNTLISQLREEVGHLQMCKETPVSDESEKLKVLFEEIEMLKKESKDKDERMNKIKAVAVKAKKELDGSKKEVLGLREEAEQLRAERDHLSRSVKDIIHGGEDYKNLMVDYDKQMELLDQERDKLEQAEKCSEDLTKRLQSALQQNELLSSEREDLAARVETLRSNVRLLETQALELQKQKSGLERDLEAERLVREQKTREHQCAVRELEELQAQLSRHTLQLQQTAQELEQLRKDAQQSSLLDMEMADYEKLVRELNQKLSERDRQLEEQDAHAQAQQEREQRLNQEIESLKLQLDQTEEKASKMKQLLVKTKKDLADAKQKEAAQMISQSTLRGELEAQQQQLDGYKIQVSELTAERHRLQEQLKLMSEQQHRSSSSYQLSVNTLQDQLSSAKADLVSTVSEFESYKVRVHNVLKQQKHKSSGQSDGDVFKQEREHMEDVLEQLRSRLQETQQSLLSSTSELQQLQTEHDTLLERHNRILQESVSKEAELRERLLSLQSENVSLKSEHGQCASQLSAQTEALRSSFREQTRHLQDEHCRTVETLQQQVGRLETQLFQLQKEPVSTGTGHQSRRSVLDRKSTDVSHVDLQSMAREECEGMETTETESLSSTGTPLPSLEQLLSTAELKHEPVVWQEEPSKEELTLKLSTAARSVEHLNSLLHETEATNAVLMEQITLLKSEVRRLERNHEREKSVANLEYLKNVLLQFIFLRSGSERQALLPVIHTMLQLSPDEKSKLAAIAQGEEESAVSRGSGWTSYLHSWSGIR